MNIIIDPASWHYESNKLFDSADANLNRDGTLLPFIRLKEHLQNLGNSIVTVDMFDCSDDEPFIFISFSEPRVVNKYKHIMSRASKNMLILIEPELVRARSYRELKHYSNKFDFIYSHNISQLPLDQRHKYRHLFFPQAFNEFVKNSHERMNKTVMIAGAHTNYFDSNENYSERIRAVGNLANDGFVDLYGNGWDKVGFRQALNPVFIRYKSQLKSSYKGSVTSKLSCYLKYDFALCFENQDSEGYITEKIFDCLLAGCIPIYKGAPDIAKYIPRECYIDFEDFSSYDELTLFLNSMSHARREEYRIEAEKYIKSDAYLLFFNSLVNMINESL